MCVCVCVCVCITYFGGKKRELDQTCEELFSSEELLRYLAIFIADSESGPLM